LKTVHNSIQRYLEKEKLTVKSTKFNIAIAVLIAFALLFSLAPGKVLAYGNTAIYQVGISGNCDNPAICGQDLGGFWGWAEFDQGGTGDATIAGCGHLISAGPVHAAGADFAFYDISSWWVDKTTHTFMINATVTFTGKNPPPPQQITGFDTGIPAAPGHYNTKDLLGFSAPGVNFQMQVAQIPNR
jgi:hypothetical protein